MTKSELFKAAHALAKTFVGNYRACFVMALAEIRESNVIIPKSDMCFGDMLLCGSFDEVVANNKKDKESVFNTTFADDYKKACKSSRTW